MTPAETSDTRRRLAALAAAVVVVLVAVVVRARLDDGDGGRGDGGGRVLVCPPELAQVCERAGGDPQVRVEDAAVTADALVAAGRADEVEGDLWLVPRPWAEAVSDARERANDEAVSGDPVGPIARSPVTIVVWEDRAAALEAGACAGTVGWRCVGDAADRPWADLGGEASWGDVRVGLSDPASATGLAVLGGAAGGYFERADYATNDFDRDLSSWLGALAVTADQARDDPVPRMLTRGPGEFAALGVLEADAVAASATGRDDVRVVVPEPVATADLVVVPLGDGGGDAGAADDLAGDGNLLDALAGAGWRVSDREPATGVDTGLRLPDDDGLPDGAVLRALLDRWRELI